jgi:hypothetical protein
LITNPSVSIGRKTVTEDLNLGATSVEVGLGMAAASSNRPGADVLFDNFVVRRASPPSASSSDIPGIPPPEGQVVYEDDFSDPASGWPSTDSANYSSVGYAAGAYQILANPGKQQRSTPNHFGTFTDASAEVDITQLEGPENSTLAVFCRATEKNDVEYLGYAFYVMSDGAVGIGRVRSPIWVFEHLAGAKNVGLINVGTGETNRLRADCVGQTLTLSVNGEKLLEAEDDAISASGRVGFFVVNNNPGERVVAWFDNFVVRET